MTMEYSEEPRSGYFNCWTGRYPKSTVRTIDLRIPVLTANPLVEVPAEVRALRICRSWRSASRA